MRHVETSQRLLGIFIIVTLVIGLGTFAWHNWVTPPKSNAQKQAECVSGAGKTYDAERRIIARSTYSSEAERAHYYQTSSDGYTTDLANCHTLYP